MPRQVLCMRSGIFRPAHIVRTRYTHTLHNTHTHTHTHKQGRTRAKRESLHAKQHSEAFSHCMDVPVDVPASHPHKVSRRCAALGTQSVPTQANGVASARSELVRSSFTPRESFRVSRTGTIDGCRVECRFTLLSLFKAIALL